MAGAGRTLAYLWEALEHYLEAGLAGAAVTYWFQGVEYWPNRLLSDPLMLVIGYWIAGRYPRLVIPGTRLGRAAWTIPPPGTISIRTGSPCSVRAPARNSD